MSETFNIHTTEGIKTIPLHQTFIMQIGDNDYILAIHHVNLEEDPEMAVSHYLTGVRMAEGAIDPSGDLVAQARSMVWEVINKIGIEKACNILERATEKWAFIN